MAARARPVLVGVVLSALLVAAYARGAWPLAFVLLVPWLVALDGVRGAHGALLAALAMAVGFVAAAFGWFAPAIADYTGMPTAAAMGLLLAASPLLQPQLIAYALVRRLASHRCGAVLRPVLAIAAWLAVEWAVPRLFGDTLGHGLQPSRLLRQAADVAGAAGLTLVVLAVNEALALAIARRRASARVAYPLAFAAALPLLLAGYGSWRLAGLPSQATGTPLRIGLVQAAIVDYERRRREQGAYAVVREVLDTHFALSMQLRRRGADALVWPETVYPTTFGQPRSAAAAELDRELAGFAVRAGVPLVFGTYARDDDGEYNVAAFVDPARGPLGAYRKTRLFPLTEHVPRAIDSPVLRRLLPWAGTWQPGDGARVFPLVTADGREVPVAPLICRDDVDPSLARDGARLGAQLLVGLSNDAWFTRAPLGARLHLASASFRSVETRLPQVRATTNGLSAVIDSSGEIIAQTAMGERTTLLAQVRVQEPVGTLFVRFGSWLGPASVLVLLSGGLFAAWGARRTRRVDDVAAAQPDAAEWMGRSHSVLLLRPWQRIAIGLLRTASRAGVLVLGIAALASSEPPRMLEQLRQFATWVLVPELAAAALAYVCSARLTVEPGRLVLDSAHRRFDIDRSMLARPVAWRWPWPRPGFDLLFRSGKRWAYGIALGSAATALRALAPIASVVDAQTGARCTSGGSIDEEQHDVTGAEMGQSGANTAASALAATLPTAPTDAAAPSPAASACERPSRHACMLAALDVASWRIDHPLVKFVLFALVPALPAFRLHQLIAYGSPFGEYYTFGLHAYLGALLIWWASWVVTLVLIAGGLRLFVEACAAATVLLRPQRARAVRRALLGAARAAYFLGVPIWLVMRLVSA